MLRNAISPVLTTSGVQIGALLGGSVLVETIFRWPGMGLLVFTAISARDLLVVQGATLVIAADLRADQPGRRSAAGRRSTHG